MTMTIITHLVVFALGGLLGVAILAVVSINKPEPDDEDVSDTELLDFMTRNDLGLSVIKRPSGNTMWGVTTAMPVKVIGALNDDPRDALTGAMVLMLEKESVNG